MTFGTHKQEKSFNPRPREGGDPQGSCIPLWGHVSIHAPAKGATTIHAGRKRRA